MTKDEFLKRAREVHGDKYDYSQINFINATTPIKIICHEKWATGEEHGTFWQVPLKHLKGQGCGKCKGKGKTREIVIAEFQQIHGDKYDYSEVVYKGAHIPVKVICHKKWDNVNEEHGEFWVTPSNHLEGHECKKCQKLYMNTDLFIKKARAVHGDKYDYSKVDYVNDRTLIDIICPIHGLVPQLSYSHLHTCGCNKCANRYQDTDLFIKKARAIHGDKYDYSKVNYTNNRTNVIITCPVHGDFSQTPADHLDGCGCKECGKNSRIEKRRMTKDEFLKRAREVHGDKYDYSKVEFSRCKDIITIICPIHGEFSQGVYSHLEKCGCPSCAHFVSAPEAELRKNIEDILHISLESRNRKIIPPYEIDLYDNATKIGIEYHGLIWHSERFYKNEKYHQIKSDLANSKNVHLIQIFEDEYMNHKDLVLKRLEYIFKKQDTLISDTIKKISPSVAKEYIQKHKLDSLYESSVYIGSFYKNKLNGIVSFKKRKEEWYLGNVIFDNYEEPISIIEQIIKYFVKTNNVTKIIGFLDKRWYNKNNFLKTIGFNFIKETKPECKYYSNKFPNCRYTVNEVDKMINNKFHKLTDRINNGWYRIWDAGKLEYILNF